MAPEFSVVIPTFGRPEFLAAAIDSVLAQTVTDFEVVVVDDASPQAAVLPPDSRVRLVRRATNGGPPAARNSGIDAAQGRYVAFLDDDDVWTPDRLALARAGHDRAPVAICWQATLGDSTTPPHGRRLDGNVGDVVLDGMTPHLGATSIERERAPRFDERYGSCEDVDWWLRVAQTLPVTTTPQVGLRYRYHGGPRERTGMRARVDDAQTLLREHRDWFRAHPHAEAFRLERLGLSALRVNDRGLALRSFARSLRLRPDARTAWHALRALAPRRAQVDA
ncbi:MAG TPA: glycosyltransferase [Acidimicrobiia bacterium]|nr:glycosyltransferase [Acidimicrobiia bacterium]